MWKSPNHSSIGDDSKLNNLSVRNYASNNPYSTRDVVPFPSDSRSCFTIESKFTPISNPRKRKRASRSGGAEAPSQKTSYRRCGVNLNPSRNSDAMLLICMNWLLLQALLSLINSVCPLIHHVSGICEDIAHARCRSITPLPTSPLAFLLGSEMSTG